MPATAELLATIAKLPHGAVVLPGLDTELDEPSWTMIAGDADEAAPRHGHPQFAMQALLARIGIARDEVTTLRRPAGTAASGWCRRRSGPPPRPHLWRERVAEVAISRARRRARSNTLSVDRGRQCRGGGAGDRDRAARGGRTRAGKTAALVTPDRALARRVLAALARWNITVDDSGGDALADTPAGVFARLAAEAALERLRCR
mgnify:CR=1 FL=1